MKRLFFMSFIILSCVPKDEPRFQFLGEPSDDGAKLVITYRIDNSSGGQISIMGDNSVILTREIKESSTYSQILDGPYETVDIIYSDPDGNKVGGSVLTPMEIYRFKICLYDSCNNGIGFKDLNYSLFSGNSIPSGYVGFKLIRFSDTIRFISVISTYGWIKASSPITSYIAPDASQYSDTVVISPYNSYAIWFDSDNIINSNDRFGKIRLINISGDSAEIEVALQTMKGLRWIKGWF